MISIVALLVLVAFVVVAAIMGYKIYYTYKINQKIQSGEITGRVMMDMSKMVMTAVIAGLTILSLLLMYIVHGYSSQTYTTTSRNDFAIIDVSDEGNYKYISYMGMDPLEDASFAKVYSKEANEGYDKEVSQSGKYEFTVFTRNTPADNFHPDFLCFVQYIGEKDSKWIGYNDVGFYSLTDENDGFYGQSAGDIEDCVLFVGNLDKNCCFEIVLNILDYEAENAYMEAQNKAYEEDKGEFPKAEDYAVSTGKVSIVIE